MKELKHIEKESKSFVANGHDYYITNSLSLSRFKQFERLKIEFDLSLTIMQAKSNFIAIFSKLNENKPADAAVIAHNMANGIEMQTKRDHNPILYMCALFINRKDEDITSIDEQLMDEKVNDWAEEGFDIADFFSLARILSSNFTPDLEEDLKSTSKESNQKDHKDTFRKQ